MINIANLLSQAGHEVTIIHAPSKSDMYDKNVKGPKIAKPSVLTVDIDYIKEYLDNHNKKAWDENHENPLNFINQMYKFSSILATNCENIINDNILTQKMRDENFDLGIAELFVPCGLGILKYYNIKNTITVFSGCAFDSYYEGLGLTVPVSQLPTSVAPLSKEMNLFERLINLGSYISLKKIYSDSVMIGNYVFEKVYPEGQIDLHKLFKETSFLIDNCDPLLSFGSPTTPKFLHLGGFLNRDPKPLSEEFNNVLKKRKKNVLISFGSFTKSSTMKENMKKNLIKLFKEYSDTTFLWKFDEKNIEFLKDIDNVYLFKWLPQLDLLADSRISLFITHGGMNSFLEASKFGVPLLVIPLFGDQPKNAKIIEQLKLGKIITKSELNNNYKKLKKTFGKILNNDLYKETSKKMSLMIAERPYNQKETFIKYVEFASKFGAVEHFTIPYSNIPFWKYFYLDAILILIGIIFLIVKIIKISLKKLGKFFNNNHKDKKME
ncbi:UDP-glucuronosyl/UDP-glucosyltransferase family-containing protein [Strongyloides ratti]|uniref:glucuronosyltransferase n=1 Tax=Strongyloides ratti TaxID=34506 RepID=A0A090LVI7_STRRB|nr:UDP-glucuronosyl/UDP-glucosyltransferase family-containing protein [Strongyloides ratti]CEF71674.1 UDP-glucuronosyl/UDP-glucosyltransferase family-containing protein [Strongyloides ratti]